jgi:hypothetical protein
VVSVKSQAADGAAAPELSGRGNQELLSYLDFVWILEIVGLGNPRILIGVAVEAFADLG